MNGLKNLFDWFKGCLVLCKLTVLACLLTWREGRLFFHWMLNHICKSHLKYPKKEINVTWQKLPIFSLISLYLAFEGYLLKIFQTPLLPLLWWKQDCLKDYGLLSAKAEWGIRYVGHINRQ